MVLPPLKGQEVQKKTTETQEEEDNFKLLPVPCVSYNRSIGFILGTLPMSMYKIDPSDTISPSSIAGVLFCVCSI